MRFKVDFTLDIPKQYWPAAVELSGGAESAVDMKDFLTYEAAQYLIDYLTDNYVRGVKVIRGVPVLMED